MKILELYAGTRSIGKAFERKGHEVFSVEYDEQHPNIDLYDDVNNLTYERIIELFGVPDVIWASPDCTTYSIAGIYHHRVKEDDQLEPVSDKAVLSDKTVRHVIDLMTRFHTEHNTILFVENPRGYAKDELFNHLNQFTVTYCQYGDKRMKPTDIWTTISDPCFRRMCKNGDPCHVSAPRGSTTGTQGMNIIDKSRIPDKLCDHIVHISEIEHLNIYIKKKRENHLTMTKLSWYNKSVEGR